MSVPGTVLWIRNDRRLDDNPALTLATRSDAPVIPVFVWCPEAEGGWAPGGASRWWIHHSLVALSRSLVERGSRLVIRRGDPADVLPAIAREARAGTILWNAHHEPSARDLEARVARAAHAEELETRACEGQLLVTPRELRTTTGTPFKVFTPFWKALRARGIDASPAPPPARLAPPHRWPASLALEELQLLPVVDWAGGLSERFTPGEAGAAAALDHFLERAVGRYAQERDRPDLRSTSRLSPHLHHGEIGVRRLWARASEVEGAEPFLRQIAWREFAHHLLHHFPTTTTQPLRPEWEAFPWADTDEELAAWQRGRTGYPIVDAAMRELWRTGWMHNRARLVVGSFLVKDLLVHWIEGARWFWDTLVDADLASNTLGWQWVAGSGADAAPYFRIFNPVTQAKRFDPEGAYVKRWVPELAGLPAALVHEPWTAKPLDLAASGVRLGETYPLPVVDHAVARERALAAYEMVKSA